jgi:hypothetical protein
MLDHGVMATFRWRSLAVVLVMIATFAAPRASVADSKPWSNGVSDSVQAKANALFAEANQLFAEQAHAPAVEKYRAALALWDHPMIRYNLAVTLIRLDRLLEAAEELQHALRYGNQPFTSELYQQAQDYQRLVAGRVGDIEATCTQPDVHILLDGKLWFVCPGTKRQRVLAGEHALLGEREHFLTSARRVVVAGGAVTSQTVALVTLDSAVTFRYPIRRWVPWAIAAGGTAVGLAGLAMWSSGKSSLDQFYANLASTCPTGCNLKDHPNLVSQRNSAELKGQLGVGVMVGGGAIVVGGLVAAIVNRPKRILPKVEVAPTSTGAVAAASWRF